MSKPYIFRSLGMLDDAFPQKDSLYHIPVLHVSAKYLYSAEITEKRDRIKMNYKGRVGNAEEVAKFFFEEKGFVVLNGYDVDTFLRLFLLQIPLHILDEARDFQIRQRALLKLYLAGKTSFERVIKNAMADAKLYYLPPKRQSRKIWRLRSDIEWALPTSRALKPESYTEDQKREKESCLNHLSNTFFSQCLRKSELKRLVRAYQLMTKGNPPDLFVYDPTKRLWFFTEVKSFNDFLRPNQWDWIAPIQQYLGGHIILTRVMPVGRDLRDRLRGW